MLTGVASGQGPVASAIGQTCSITIVPRADFTVCRILASGDPGATLLTGMAGEVPLVIDPIDCSLLTAAAYHGPVFDAPVCAGVPVTFTYTAASTTAALRLTLVGWK